VRRYGTRLSPGEPRFATWGLWGIPRLEVSCTHSVETPSNADILRQKVGNYNQQHEAFLKQGIMKTYVDYADIEHMELAANCQRDRLLIRLLSRLGCRISKALSIKVQDIDFGRKTITILHLKRNIRLCCPKCGARLGKRHQFCPGCGNVIDEATKSKQERRRIRVLPVDESTVDMIRKYLDRDKLHEDDGLAPLFCLNRHRAWQIVRYCAQRAGLPDLVNPETGRVRGVSPHRLRDAFSVHAMKLDDSGDALRLLQQHLGHANFDTAARYRKIAGEEHRQWYDRLWDEST